MIGQSPVVPDSAEQVESRTQPSTDGATPVLPREVGGREGPEPTRYGDWEKNGRCVDF